MPTEPDPGETVYTATLTVETRDHELRRTLAAALSEWASEREDGNPGLDWDVTTGRYSEGRLDIPDAVVDELADRVEARLRERRVTLTSTGGDAVTQSAS